MVRRLLVLMGLILFISLSAHAQDRVEVFGGYSFERYGGSPGRNLNGWEISGQYKFSNWIGAVADLDAHYGLPSNIDSRTVNFMVGPQISFPGPISPFVHVLVGIGHIRSGSADTSFASAFGGGIDMRVFPALSWRVIQADEVVTRFFGGTQRSARLSTGLVIRF
jgi:hypothetical protein